MVVFIMKLRKKIILLLLTAIMLIQGPIVALATEPTEYDGVDATDDDVELEHSYERDYELNTESDEILDSIPELDNEEPVASSPASEEPESLPEEDYESEEPEEVDEITQLQKTGVTVIDNVGVYSEPDGETINQLLVNTDVLITGYNDTWYRIIYNGITGWVASSSVQQTRQTAVVTSNDALIRAEDSANAEILTRAETGTRVLIEQRSTDWALVAVDEQTGWINVSDLSIADGRRPARIINATKVHATPDASSTASQSLAANQEVMVMQRTTNGNGINEGWTQIQTTDNDEVLTGWVLTDQIELRVQTRHTTGDGEVFVRTGPQTSFAEEKRIDTDTSVTILAEAGTWSHVRFTEDDERHYGWIANSRLTSEIIDVGESVMPSPASATATATSAATTTVMRRTGVTVINNANFRRGPGTNHGVIRSIPVNTNVRISGRQGSWYRVVHSGTTGWIARSSVQQTRQTAVVRGNNSPVRASRNTNANILTRAPRGTRVLIQRRSPNWAQVTVNGRLGWIQVSNLTITNGRRPARTRAQVNLHTRPNASSNVVRNLPSNQQLMVVQRTTNGNAATQGWTRVIVHHHAFGTQRGWIRTNQVELRVQTRRTRGTGTVPVRTGPGNNFTIARRINTNVQVTVLAEAGGWSHIRFTQNGVRHYGWVVHARLARVHNQITTLTRAESLSQLALVNRNFRLASNFSPGDLRVVNVRSVNGNHRLRGAAANAAENLFQSASNSGHTLLATSGYRSFATQQATHNHWINVLGPEQARRVSAQPGHSEHQLGLALDVSTLGLGGALSSNFSNTPEGRWLRNNAHRFGFIIRYPQNREADTGYAYEPWHIRFVGVSAATEIFNRGWILEEFLRQ